MKTGLDRSEFVNPTAHTFSERGAALTEYLAHRTPCDYLSWCGYLEIAACYALGVRTETANSELAELLADPFGDMFWMYPTALLTCLGPDRVPARPLDLLRNAWRTYTPYRGDTENHWAMYHASLYLMAEKYHGDRAGTWFNGRSSEENRTDAADYLQTWMDTVWSRGLGEFASPHYLPMFLTSLSMLAGFATDREMRERSGSTLGLLLADFAASLLNGEYVGGHSRIYPTPTLERWRNGSTTWAWLAFGATRFEPDGINVVLPWPGYRPHASALSLALSDYEPSYDAVRLANERSKPFVQRSRHRTRHRIRYSEQKSPDVFRTTYMTPDYVVSSIQGGLLQPIQQHTWEVLWKQESGERRGHNMLFTVHPYSDGKELGMYFPEEPRLLTEAVLKSSKETYDSPDKWTGASPFERVSQHRDTVIALYSIPEGTRFDRVSGFFSRGLADTRVLNSGWIVARVSRMYLAYYPLAEYEFVAAEDGSERLVSRASKNGAIVQCAAQHEYDSLDAFSREVGAHDPRILSSPEYAVELVNHRGSHIRLGFETGPFVDGQPMLLSELAVQDGPVTVLNGSVCIKY